MSDSLKTIESSVDGIGSRRSGSVAHVAAWDAIQGYVRACGGDPDLTGNGDLMGNGRMDAVVKIERAIEARASELSAAAHIDDDALERAIFDLEHAAETRSGVTRACNALRNRLKPLIAKARECETLREKLSVEEDRRSDEIRERHCAEERAHSAEVGNDVLKAEVVRMDAETAALRKQICRLVSGQAIESDHLCQHLDADVEARAEIARLTADLNATRIALTRESPATPATHYLCPSCGIDHTKSNITKYPEIVTIRSGPHKGKIGAAIEWRRDGAPAWVRVIVGVDDHGFEIRENFDPCQLVVRAGGG